MKVHGQCHCSAITYEAEVEPGAGERHRVGASLAPGSARDQSDSSLQRAHS